MSDDQPATRPCPFCKEDIKADALRCKHCHAAINPAGPVHRGICPYCKENINPEAVRCKHCHANLALGVPAVWPQAYQRQGPAARRSYRKDQAARAALAQATLANILPTEPEPRAARCPASILDTSPDGSGLGVWVLVESDAESCTYEYAGGIA